MAAQLKHIRIVSESDRTEVLPGNGMTINYYPELGKEVRVLAVLDDGSELDLSRVVESVEWVAQPGTAPVARVSVLAPEVDVLGWVEQLQLSPKEKVLRALGNAEENEKAGLPRQNFGSRYALEVGVELAMDGNDVERIWSRAWVLASADRTLRGFPDRPTSIEGMNRLLEKRRQASGVGETVRIREWVDGEWVG